MSPVHLLKVWGPQNSLRIEQNRFLKAGLPFAESWSWVQELRSAPEVTDSFQTQTNQWECMPSPQSQLLSQIRIGKKWLISVFVFFPQGQPGIKGSRGHWGEDGEPVSIFDPPSPHHWLPLWKKKFSHQYISFLTSFFNWRKWVAFLTWMIWLVGRDLQLFPQVAHLNCLSWGKLECWDSSPSSFKLL